MTTISNLGATRAQQPFEADGRSEEDAEYTYWRERSRVVISPVSSPSVLGLFGFSAATLVVAGNLAGWYGPGTHNGMYFAPFCLAFGGVAQFLAGMWSYKARDTLATAMHGMWGSFWIAYGILWFLLGTKAIPVPGTASHTYWVTFGMWFVMLGALTGVGALAALGKNLGLFATLGLLAAGSDLLAAGLLSGNHTTVVAAGWVLVASVGAAIYTGAALLFADTYGRTILPLGKLTKKHNIPGRVIVRPIEYPGGMPGVRIGQ